METAEKIADIILDNPRVVSIRWMGIKMGIKPLKLGTLIYIGRAASKMDGMVPENIMAVIGTAGVNAMPMAKVISYSILNNKTLIRLFGKMLARLLLWRLTPKDLLVMLQIVITQSSVTDFFSCTVLTKGISPIKAVEPLKEGKQYGERLQEPSRI